MEGKGVISSTMGDLMVAAAADMKKPKQNWMAFVAIGFLAGAIFGALVASQLSIKEQAQELCGVCINNYNILAKSCGQPTSPFTSKNVSILPGVVNGSVVVYAP